ncbi:MAG: hypothetical protein LBT51_09635 [Fusobacteriaceae bacterium]|jgi:GTP-binding protein Era|nr:hypothetical protein [Fusobacteriaceae bacterium]
MVQKLGLEKESEKIKKLIEKIKDKKTNAKKIVTAATVSASAAAIVTIPLAGIAVITPIQIAMVVKLASMYDLGITKEAIAPFIAAALGRQAATSLLHIIPFWGQAINATVAGTITGGNGMYCMSVFEEVAIAKLSGEEIKINLKISEIKKYFR